jgi:hypothetical protein
MRLALKLHPDSICVAVTGIEVDVARQHDGSLSLSYAVTGKIGDLRMSSVAASARADELWRSTCFEAFIRAVLGEAYYEFNFAPSTRWAAYRFDGYRTGMRIAHEIAAPRIEVQSAPERYTLRATPGLSTLPHAGWHLGLSAVIEETSGRKSYWALAHPPGKADFHHADCFAHELSPA